MFNPLLLNCPHCGGTLQAKDSSDQGKDVRCPRCSQIFRVDLHETSQVPLNQTQVTTGKPAPGRIQSKWVLALVAIVFLSAIGGVVGLFYKSAPSSGLVTIDLTYLPPEIDVVGRLNVSELLASQQLRDVTNSSVVESILGLVTAQTGVLPRQIDSITLGVVVLEGPRLPGVSLRMPSSLQSPQPVVVVRSGQTFDPEDIAVKRLKGVLNTYSGKSYYRIPVLGKSQVDSCYFPEPNVLVIGPEKKIHSIIDQGKTPPHIPAFDFVPTDRTLVIAATADAFDFDQINPVYAPTVNLQHLIEALKDEFKSGCISLSARDLVEFEVTLNCIDEPAAERVKKNLEPNLTDAKDGVKKLGAMLSVTGMGDLHKLGEETLNGVTVLQVKDRLTVTGTVPKELQTVLSKYTKILSPVVPTSLPGRLLPAVLPHIPGIPFKTP